MLVVDDEPFIREITRRNLEAHGYRVLTAREGNEAVALYARHREDIDVVLTDMMMPGMDGAATIRALRELNPAVRIVAVSGLAAASDPNPGQPSRAPKGGRQDPGPAGVQAFLPKPYKAETLLQTLDEVLRA